MAHEHNHSHDHAHGHSHVVTAAQATSKAFLWGIVLNLLYVIVEAIAGFWTHSLALLTDAGHNLSDVAGLALSLIAFKLAKVKPSQNFTYGYKKSTILAALTNAMLLLVAIGVLGYESVIRLQHPQPLRGGIVAWVAGLGIIINVASALFFRGKDELNNRGAYLHLMADAVVSVGVVIAGIIIKFTGWYWLDPVIGLVIMVVILAGTWGLLRDSFKLAIDAVPMGIKLDQIKTVIRKVPDVAEVNHVHGR